MQNQALNALVFLYKAVLERPLGGIGGVVRARRPQRLHVVLHVREVKALLRHLEGSHWLAACLMYGSGLRLMEALRLRVKDLDFEHRAIVVRDGKGQKDRVVTRADELIVSLQRHLEGRLRMKSALEVALACVRWVTPRKAQLTPPYIDSGSSLISTPSGQQQAVAFATALASRRLSV
jgi:integrase